MDENILLSAFSASLGADNEARNKAHEYLQGIRSTPGLVPLLATISLSPSHSMDLRQVAVIYLKNLCKNWKDSNSEYSIPRPDKDFLKFHILTGLSLSIPEKIRSQFEEIANTLAKNDYPWEEVLGQILAGLNEPSLVYAALNMIYQISKNYEYTMNEKRTYLLNLVARFSPKILEILKSLVGFTNIECFSYVQLILQIYWVSMYIELHPIQTEAAVLDEWMTCFRLVLEHPMGDLQNKPDTEENEKIQEKLPQWMCKKWAVQIVHRFFTRYFNLAHLKQENLCVGQRFQGIWAAEFFKVIIPQLFQVKEKFIPSLVLNYYLKYACQSVKFLPTFGLFDEVSISHLMINVIMPVLYRVKSDDELWRENPIEFIRKDADLGKAYYSPKSSAIDLLLTLCEKGILVKFFEYVTRELQQSTDLLQKEAIMLVLGSLSEQIKNSPIKDHIESMLAVSVFPEFVNQIGFLRARAAWVYSRFSNLPFESPDFKAQGLEAVCKLLLDPELPVRYEASLALPRLLKWSISKSRLSGELKSLLEIYLKIMNEIDSEDIVESLESVISAFPKEIIPFALELTQHLAGAFMRMVGKDINEDEGEGAMAAASTLNTIAKIIDVLEESPEDLAKISFILVPVFDYCFSERGCDYFEETLNLLTCLLYYTPENSMPHLYYLLKNLRASILEEGGVSPFAIEHIDETFSAIANFIKKYKQQTLENLPWILEMAFSLLRDKEQEAINGCKILIAVLENYKAALDECLPRILAELSAAFASGSKKVKIGCSQAMNVALWNSTLLTLSAGPLVSPAFQFSLANVRNYTDSMARYHVVHGFGSLFLVIPQLPLQVVSTLPAVFKAIVQMCQDFDEESSADAEEFGDDQKVSVGLDAQCQKIIDKIRAIGPDDDDEDEENDLLFGGNAEDLYDSPFETMNQNELIKEIIQILSGSYPEVMKSINELLTETEAKLLNSLIQ